MTNLYVFEEADVYQLNDSIALWRNAHPELVIISVSVSNAYGPIERGGDYDYTICAAVLYREPEASFVANDTQFSATADDGLMWNDQNAEDAQ